MIPPGTPSEPPGYGWERNAVSPPTVAGRSRGRQVFLLRQNNNTETSYRQKTPYPAPCLKNTNPTRLSPPKSTSIFPIGFTAFPSGAAPGDARQGSASAPPIPPSALTNVLGGGRGGVWGGEGATFFKRGPPLPNFLHASSRFTSFRYVITKNTAARPSMKAMRGRNTDQMSPARKTV